MLKFTDEQLKIITSDVNPKLVIAGAGSGKTTVMIGLIKALCGDPDLKKVIDYQLKPDEIIALSFTRDNVKHFKDSLPTQMQAVQTYTIDRLATLLLSEISTAIKLPVEFQTDLTNILCANGFYNFLQAKDRLDQIKQRLHLTTLDWQTLTKIVLDNGEDYRMIRDLIVHDFNLWQLKAHQRIVYNLDTIYDLIEILMQQVDLQVPCKLLIIDEAQDLNRGQLSLVINLYRKFGTLPKNDPQYLRIALIGDPAQSIFRFNGSDPQYLMTFIRRCGVKPLKLTKNFRSSPQTLQAANVLLADNFDNVVGMQLDGQQPNLPDSGTSYLPLTNKQNQIKLIIEQVKILIDQKHVDPSEIAILVRSGLFTQYRGDDSLAEQLRQGLIKYPVADFTPLQLLLSLRKNLLQGLAEIETLHHVYETGDQAYSHQIVTWIEELTSFKHGVSLPYLRQQYYELCEKYGWFCDESTQIRLQQALKELTLANIERLRKWNHKLILQWCELMENQLTLLIMHLQNIQIEPQQHDGITLSTIHEAKGSEWQYVFVIPENAGFAYQNNTGKSTFKRNADIKGYNANPRHTPLPLLTKQDDLIQWVAQHPNNELIHHWQDQQDCAYVALTRAKIHTFIAPSNQTRLTLLDQLPNRRFDPEQAQKYWWDVPNETLVYSGFYRYAGQYFDVLNF